MFFPVFQVAALLAGSKAVVQPGEELSQMEMKCLEGNIKGEQLEIGFYAFRHIIVKGGKYTSRDFLIFVLNGPFLAYQEITPRALQYCMGRGHFYENPDSASLNDADPVRNTCERLIGKNGACKGTGTVLKRVFQK